MFIRAGFLVFFWGALAFGVDGSCSKDQGALAEGKKYFSQGRYLLSVVALSPARLSACAEIAESAEAFLAQSLWALGERDAALDALSRVSNSRAAKEQAGLLRALWFDKETTELTESQKVRFSLWQKRNLRTSFLETLNGAQLPASDREVLQGLQTRLENAEEKSLWLAGVASAVLPGAGQAYAGNYQSAAIAFLFNAIFLGATIEFVHHDLVFPAVASGLVFSVTYFGNISSAVTSARTYNQNEAAPQEKRLKEALFPELSR